MFISWLITMVVILYFAQLILVCMVLLTNNGDFKSKKHFLFWNIPIIPIVWLIGIVFKMAYKNFKDL